MVQRDNWLPYQELCVVYLFYFYLKSTHIFKHILSTEINLCKCLKPCPDELLGVTCPVNCIVYSTLGQNRPFGVLGAQLELLLTYIKTKV